MSTVDWIDLGTTIPLWVVVALRFYFRPTTQGQRAILASFCALTVSATLRLSFIDDAFGRSFGFADAAVLPKHLCAMLACVLLVGWLESVVPPRRHEPAWHRWITLKARLTLVTITGLIACAAFPFSEPSITAPDGSPDYASAQYGDIAGTVHLAMYLLTMGAALAPSAALCLTVARRTDDRLLRVCMRLMATGAALGTFYLVYRLSFLACGFTGWQYPLDQGTFHRGGALIQAATILFLIAGTSVRGADKLHRMARKRRGLIALRPLWVELVSVLPPDVIKRRLQEPTADRDDRYNLRDLYGRLDQRIVDISDAAFELLPWVDADLPDRALNEAHRAGLTGQEADAAREALCLRVARTRCVNGDDCARPPAVTLLCLRDDLLVNAARLARVAHHYTSPALDEAATRLANRTTAQKAAA